VCICFIGKSVLVVSQKTLRGMDAVACGMSSTTIVQTTLTCEREMATAGRTVGASRSVSPRSTSLALGSRLSEEELHLVPVRPMAMRSTFSFTSGPSGPGALH
jgi:hypothetical protein